MLSQKSMGSEKYGKVMLRRLSINRTFLYAVP